MFRLDLIFFVFQFNKTNFTRLLHLLVYIYTWIGAFGMVYMNLQKTKNTVKSLI